jgi:transcription elongation factor Elf1
MAFPFDELKNACSRLSDHKIRDPLEHYISLYFVCNCCGVNQGNVKEIQYKDPTAEFVKTTLMVCDECKQKFEWTRNGVLITLRKYNRWSNFPDVSTKYLCFGGSYGEVLTTLREFYESVISVQ